MDQANDAESERLFPRRETTKRHIVGWSTNPLSPEFFAGDKDHLVENVCPICLDNFLPTMLPIVLPCGHCFHPACILQSFVSDLTMANGGDGIEIEINNTKTCPLCRVLPRARMGPRRWSRREGDEFVRTLSDTLGCGDAAEKCGPFYFKLMSTMSRIQETIRPCRPCLPKHRRGFGTPKFCRSCSPSCILCRSESNTCTVSGRRDNDCFICFRFSDPTANEMARGCRDPMWRAKDGPEDGYVFCDSCFWMRLLVVGLAHTGSPRNRFERLEASSFLRMRPGFLGDEGSGGCLEDVSDGQNGSRGDDLGNCERCGIMIPNSWIYFVDDWCSECAPAPKGSASQEHPTPAVSDPVPPVTPTVLGLNLPTRTASPGFLAPRPTPVAPVPPPDTSSATPAPGISGVVPNSKPKPEPKLEPKAGPKSKPKPGPERVILEQSGNGEDHSEEVGSHSGGMAVAILYGMWWWIQHIRSSAHGTSF